MHGLFVARAPATIAVLLSKSIGIGIDVTGDSDAMCYTPREV